MTKDQLNAIRERDKHNVDSRESMFWDRRALLAYVDRLLPENREAPHCSSCSCGLPAEPTAVNAVEEYPCGCQIQFLPGESVLLKCPTHPDLVLTDKYMTATDVLERMNEGLSQQQIKAGYRSGKVADK